MPHAKSACDNIVHLVEMHLLGVMVLICICGECDFVHMHH